MDKVAIVILNYNGRKHLESFLPSVVAHTSYPVIVADNASTDDSVPFLKEHFPRIRLIELPQNYGFAEGYNRALKQVKAMYFVLLNSDVEVSKGWIEPLLHSLESDDKRASVQPKILSYRNKHKFEYAGAGGGLIDHLAYPYCRGRIFESLEEDKAQYDDECEIFWSSGACMMIRSSAYWEAGGFNGFYFAHMEEVDLCWRLKRRGFQVWYNGQSVVYHLGGGTLHSESPLKTYLNFRNSLITLYNNTKGTECFLKVFARLLLDAPAFFFLLSQSKWQNAWQIPKAHYSFYRYILLHHEQLIDYKTIKTLPAHAYGTKSIVWKYYVLRNKTINNTKKT